MLQAVSSELESGSLDRITIEHGDLRAVRLRITCDTKLTFLF